MRLAADDRRSSCIGRVLPASRRDDSIRARRIPSLETREPEGEDVVAKRGRRAKGDETIAGSFPFDQTGSVPRCEIV